ncbi:Elongation factor Ts [Bienertia sinuspersici]
MAQKKSKKNSNGGSKKGSDQVKTMIEEDADDINEYLLSPDRSMEELIQGSRVKPKLSEWLPIMTNTVRKKDGGSKQEQSIWVSALDEEDVKDELKYWEMGVVAFVVRGTPHNVDKVIVMKKGVFMIRFLNQDTKKKALEALYMLLDGKPIVLKQWVDSMDLSINIDRVPIWLIIYEWKPEWCKGCGQIGHEVERCGGMNEKKILKKKEHQNGGLAEKQGSVEKETRAAEKDHGGSHNGEGSIIAGLLRLTEHDLVPHGVPSSRSPVGSRVGAKEMSGILTSDTFDHLREDRVNKQLWEEEKAVRDQFMRIRKDYYSFLNQKCKARWLTIGTKIEPVKKVQSIVFQAGNVLNEDQDKSLINLSLGRM